MYLLHEAKFPILWALKPSDAKNSSDYSCEDIIRKVIIQWLGIYLNNSSSLQMTEEALAWIYRKFHSASSLPDWIDLLGATISISGMPLIYILIDVHLLAFESGARKRLPRELTAALLRLPQHLRDRGVKTVVKIILVSYGGAMFDEDENPAQFKNVLISVGSVKHGKSTPAQRRTAIERNVLGRLPHRDRGGRIK